MKKLLLAGLVLAGVSAFGAIDVAFSNIVGVVRVMSTNKYTLVSVPFGAVGMNLANANETISNLVQTLNFDVRDKIQIYSDQGNVMFSWSLNKNRVWAPMMSSFIGEDGELVEYTPESAAATRVERGWALRVYRRTPTYADGSPKPFYLIGQYDSLHGERVLPAGTKLVCKKSLVSFPGVGAFELSSIQEGVCADDRIFLENDASQREYSPVLEEDGRWSWGYSVTKKTTKIVGGRPKTVTVTERVTTDSVVPCGAGFWYYSFGGAPVIRW